jgi:hypothetical protein
MVCALALGCVPSAMPTTRESWLYVNVRHAANRDWSRLFLY